MYWGMDTEREEYAPVRMIDAYLDGKQRIVTVQVHYRHDSIALQTRLVDR